MSNANADDRLAGESGMKIVSKYVSITVTIETGRGYRSIWTVNGGGRWKSSALPRKS